jgi:hypothetical protein
MGVKRDVMLGARGLGDTLHGALRHIEYGQIDCREQGAEGWAATAKKHQGLMLYGENRAVTRMLDLLDNFPKAAIVLEDFILDFNKADMARHTLSPVRITSAFCYGMEQQGFSLDQVHVQNRSLAKTTCTDLRLKNWGLYDSHSGPHARDAVRHCYYFLRNCRGAGIEAQENRHNAWPHLFADPLLSKDADSPTRVKKPEKIGERITGLG